MDIYEGINIRVFNGSPVGRSREEYLLDDELARKCGIWIMIIGRDRVNMISLNLKTIVDNTNIGIQLENFIRPA